MEKEIQFWRVLKELSSWEARENALLRMRESLTEDVILAGLSLAEEALKDHRLEDAQAWFGVMQKGCELMGEASLRLNARSMRKFAKLLVDHGEYDEAKELYQQARNQFFKLDMPAEIALCDLGLADVMDYQDDYDEANRLYQEVREQFVLLNMPAEIALCDLGLAIVMEEQDEFEEAERLHRQVREQFVLLNMPYGIARCDLNMANMKLRQGKYEEAERLYKQARKQFVLLNSPIQIARCNLNMANVMLREGKYDEAERLYKQAREQFVLLNSPYEIASCDGNLAIVAGAQGKYDEAKRLLQQAREQFAKLNMPAAIAHCNLGIAEMMRQQGEYDEAKRLCQQAREQLAQLNMPSFVADCNFILAEIMRQIGEYDESKKLYQAGLDKSIDETRWELLFGLGKVNFEQGNPKEASTYYEESISVIESIRGRQQEDTAKTGVMHNKIDVYATMVRLCCEQEDFEKAFEYAERAKSRALLDLMEQATRGLKAKTHKGQAAKDTAIDARAKASKKSDDETPENGPNLLSIALKAEEELSEEDFELASFISVQARTLEEIRVSLPKDTALLEYFYEGDTAYVFSVMQDDLFVEEFDIGVVRPLAEVTENRREFENAEELLTGVEGNEEVTILRGMLHPDAPVIAQGELSIKDWLCYTTFALYESRNEPTGEIKQVKRGSNLRIKDEAYEHLAILYRELIRPMQDVVDAAERIVIVPHGVLHYVPFSALIDVPEGREREAKQLIQMGEAKYLIETKTISMMPSGSMIDVCQKKPRPQPENCLAVSQPALGKDERPIIYRCELEDYFSEEKTELLLEQAATIPNFVQAAHTHLHSVIHFDTHGMLNANNGLYSWLAMSKPTEYGAEIEPLYAKDIFNLDFRSCIVVLRACMSGLGKVHPGDDIIGLTRAFFYAGTPSIVASMWEVDDRESHDLIETFYDAWLECGDKAEALRQAQLEAMKFLDDLGEERHPYHWAGFALYGDWKDEKP